MARFWNKYGDWDKIAASENINFIMSRITGKPVDKWRANHMSDKAADAISTIMAESADRWGPQLAALDFGCGVGRNAALLSKYFGTLYGVDIEEMVKQFDAQDPIKARHLYSSIYTNLEDASKAQKFHLLYDSVVFQHIIDQDFTDRCVEVIDGHESLDCFVSLSYHTLGKINVIKKLEAKGWSVFHEEVEAESFLGSPHTLFILRRARL